eukprot:CAMPEP_0182484996 /NCGR_PEP_ID=MMETSP1319-20130603/44457_1 /TAXON_ID=172717 /ORGANISM="Bolidomonas pacifica, Strain RCC208" /LENGTH=263 /DNA_ID=CAMNT_0024686933 /DNA_START=16 /DNA_END=804 /DNA_ORIENTATION=+
MSTTSSDAPAALTLTDKASKRGRRLSVTMLGGSDIKKSSVEVPTAPINEKKPIDRQRRSSVRRRSIVSATETVDREVALALTKAPETSIAKAVQTPLEHCVHLLGQIMHMDDLPIMVHDKVEKVLDLLGEPESLLTVKLQTEEKSLGMDEASKQWYNEFLAGVPEIDDKSETASQKDEYIDDAGEILPISDPSDIANNVDGAMRVSSSHRRRRQMKQNMSDISPSQLVNDGGEEEEEEVEDEGNVSEEELEELAQVMKEAEMD